MNTPADLAAIKDAVNLPGLVGETVAIRREGKLWKGCCPFHAERSPSFIVYDRHYHCYGCGAHGDALDWLQRQRGMTFSKALLHLGGSPQPSRETVNRTALERQAAPTDAQERRMRAIAMSVWAGTAEPAGTPVEAYLHSRGLRLPDAPVIRFHPQCYRGSERLPAMVALLTDAITNVPTGVHRTFLKPDGSGKADGNAKMVLGNWGVIRLLDDTEVTLGLGITEGIETGLAVMQQLGWLPIWAAGTAGGIANFPVLDGIEAITVFPDRDDSGVGIDSARTCARRWVAAGRHAYIETPPDDTDWHDAAAATRRAA